ncbi:hypothetical protein Y1Q_0003086 [Alligator mississippiensis]|uniref:Uncharacterized protein n=1 Tax=Alligator mississippiensis TaxID=8496 RepID=A0A151MDE3_ALLMI|nr:hypothetical protein Y1Q_0003086 [Alligator mississippiensis]
MQVAVKSQEQKNQTPKGTYSFLPQRVNVHMVYVKLYECKPGAACAAVCWCQELRHAGNLLKELENNKPLKQLLGNGKHASAETDLHQACVNHVYTYSHIVAYNLACIIVFAEILDSYCIHWEAETCT